MTLCSEWQAFSEAHVFGSSFFQKQNLSRGDQKSWLHDERLESYSQIATSFVCYFSWCWEVGGKETVISFSLTFIPPLKKYASVWKIKQDIN
jgi:hypothetical protein